MGAYEDALEKCSTDWAPWYVIPANRKWFRNLAVAEILATTVDQLKPKYPKPPYDPKAIVIQ
jgi:polyphosphate kinase 2 (PPK2 family)